MFRCKRDTGYCKINADGREILDTVKVLQMEESHWILLEICRWERDTWYC